MKRIGRPAARTSASVLASASAVVARSRRLSVPVAATTRKCRWAPFPKGHGAIGPADRAVHFRLMRSRLLLRRAGAAAGIYSSAALGFAATIVAAHVFSRHTFGLFAIVLAAT